MSKIKTQSKIKSASAKLWGGRFSQGSAKIVEKLSASIEYDSRLALFDIEGSLAHTSALENAKVLTAKESARIKKGLLAIAKEIKNNKFIFRPELEDVHMNIEQALIDRIGEAGKKLHTGRSRNDQVITDLRLYQKTEIIKVIALLESTINALVDLAELNPDYILPGYTHLQRAQPVLLAHHLLAYAHMFERDVERFTQAFARTDVCPLGSAALAGTAYPIDRCTTAGILGFSWVSTNSMDAVSDRDFVLDFLSASAITAMHLSRLSEELVIWSSKEFSFVEISDAFSTGSSIMPQKKNPDVAELVRGKSGRVFGNLVGMLTVLKGLPLTYNRDLQEDKEALFDTVDTITVSLTAMAAMIPEIKFNKENMRTAAIGGYTTATDFADALVGRGVPFRDAHRITGELVAYGIKAGKELWELSLEEFYQFYPYTDAKLLSSLSLNHSLLQRNVVGGTSPEQVNLQIRRWRERRRKQNR